MPQPIIIIRSILSSPTLLKPLSIIQILQIDTITPSYSQFLGIQASFTSLFHHLPLSIIQIPSIDIFIRKPLSINTNTTNYTITRSYSQFQSFSYHSNYNIIDLQKVVKRFDNFTPNRQRKSRQHS